MPESGDGQVKVVVDAVHAEARKWRGLSDDMNAVRGDVGKLALSASAFFFADIVSVAAHTAAYSEFHNWYVELLSGAATEFDEIGGALDKSADAYVNADTRSGVDLRTIYGTQPEEN
jgi:hypothetical protein